MKGGTRSGWLRVAGVMTGTSMDAVDVAIVDCHRRYPPRLRQFQTRPFTERQRLDIMIADSGCGVLESMARLNYSLGDVIGAAVASALRKSEPGTSLVAMHGQTVFHQGGVATLQVGEPACVAAATGLPVVSNFRAADIAAGGEGAPLVPWVDFRLFRDRKRYRVALNLGGIANLTLLPPNCRAEEVVAFDTGPGNMLMDDLARRLLPGKPRMDRNGAGAARGRVLPELLEAVLLDSYFARRPPKSTGRDEFGKDFTNLFMRASQAASPADLLATAAELTAFTVVAALPHDQPCEVIVSGGGAANRHLMSRLAALAPWAQWTPSDAYGIPTQAKEAIAFALLGAAHVWRVPANLPSVTGAKRSVLLGSYTPAPGRA